MLTHRDNPDVNNVISQSPEDSDEHSTAEEPLYVSPAPSVLSLYKQVLQSARGEIGGRGYPIDLAGAEVQD